MRKPQTVFAMAPANLPRLFDDTLRARLAAVADIDFDVVVQDFVRPSDRPALEGTEVLFTCWGAPALDEKALAQMPELRAVVHSAGTVKGFVTPAVWQRGIVVSSAVAANAVPVAEYTIAMILLTGKRTFPLAETYKVDSARALAAKRELVAGPTGVTSRGGRSGVGLGNFGHVVGIVGASRVGRKVIELLRPYDLEVVLADPTVDAAAAEAMGVRLVELDDLMRHCDVVSIHAPDLPQTRQLFDARRLALLRDGATLINTARGRLIDTAALTAELATGRIQAVLDVSDPEPLPAGSPLFDLPNVFVTPHIAGSLGNEIRRMGALAISELERFVRGEAFVHPVRPDEWDILA